MYNPDKNHFIFRKTTGGIIDFYHRDNLGICYSKLSKRNIWSNPVSIYKYAYESFNAYMDEEDQVHILLQDLQGNLHYTRPEGISTKTVHILSSKNPIAYNKFLQVFSTKDTIHFLYILRQEKSPILAHQTYIPGKVSKPKVVDYVYDNVCPTACVSDLENNIYAFYQSSDGKHLQMGYKKYSSNNQRWSEFIPVTHYLGDCEFPRAVIDSRGVIHLCYQRRNALQFELVYTQKYPDKDLWTSEILIHTSTHSFEIASIVWLNNSVIVYWMRDHNIYCRIGYRSGNNWGKAYKYNFASRNNLLCCSYRTNFADEAENTAIANIPGNLSNGLKLAFYKYIPNVGDTMTVENVKDLILESFRLLREDNEELKEANMQLLDEINQLKNRQAELEKELAKIEIKYRGV